MDSKEKLIIQKLFRIAQNQQKIITKLAQQQVSVPPQSLPQAAGPNTHEAQAITQALPQNVRPSIAHIEVHGGDVLVSFRPGQDSDAAFNTVQQVVTSLQQQNVLQQPRYNVKQV
jgi:hypothetical protein